MDSTLRWPRLIGHRGAARWAPENTLASFFCAYDLGASWVELDARLCRGGLPVVFHDATLERTTNGMGPVNEHRLDELRSLDAGSWFSRRFKEEPIPSLEEALAAILHLGLGVNIEIKPDPGFESLAATEVMKVAQRVWSGTTPPLVSSFSLEALKTVRETGTDWPLGYLADRFTPRHLDQAKALGAASFNLSAQHVEPGQVEALKAAGFAVMAYTVNEPEQAQALWAMGVDSIFSDDPKILQVG